MKNFDLLPILIIDQCYGLVIESNNNIGNGAFGTVFRATFKGSACAAKLLTHHAQELAADLKTANIQTAALESFQKECSLLKSLKHKNIVRHLATVTPKSNLSILVLELMDCSLKQYLEERVDVTLSFQHQISICSDISRGLSFLHSQEIIHRDLCDDNILLLAKNGDIPTAKIADFGMSRIIPHDHLSATLTVLNHRPVYLPPEAADDPHYNYTLDIYSFGVIATQIVKVKKHFKKKEELLSLFEEISDTHPLKTIICCCLADDKTKRPRAAVVYNMIHSLTIDPFILIDNLIKYTINV